MSFNNITPAWIIYADNAIQNYISGVITYETARRFLEELGATPKVMDRLMECKKEKEQQ